MDYDLTDDQLTVRDLAAGVFARHADPQHLAGIEASAERIDRDLWRELASSGVLGLAVPAEHGGAGLGLPELVLALVEQGRRVPLAPVWETAVLAGLPIARYGEEKQQAGWLPRIADGTAVLTAALEPADVQANGDTLTGRCVAVPAGHVADAVLVPCGAELFLVETDQPGVTRAVFDRTDRSRAADLILDGASAERLGAGPVEDRPAWLRERAWTGLAALHLGVGQETVRHTAAYVSRREQFGVPLGTFQAVAHQVANCHIDTEAMEATLWNAVWRLDTGRPATAAVHVARWWAADAGDRVVRTAQHLHGGLGADITYPIHRYMLWSSQLANTFGSAAWHLHQLAGQVAA